MSGFPVLLGAAALLLVWWWARRVPLDAGRKRAVLACRAVAVLAVLAAWGGATLRRSHAMPRQVIYLLDGSSSIDPQQQEWIARRVASLEALRPHRVERAVIVFGGDAAVLEPFGRNPLTDPAALQRALQSALIDRSQSHVEAAILSALALMDPARPASLVLLSDGRETAGNVSGLLGYAGRAGVSLFPSPPPPSEKMKTAWEELIVPPIVQRGAPVPVQLLLHNGAGRPKSGQVTISIGGGAIKRQRVAIRPGWQVVTVSVPALGRGTMELEASLSIPEDQLEDRRSAYTDVEGPPQLLWVGEQLSSLPPLAQALKRRDIAVAVARPADLPADASRLLEYDAVVLFSVAKSAISAEQAAALRSYVAGFGGGLVAVGLGGDLAHELRTPSPVDELLPVAFEPKGLQEAKRRVCIVMLIDRSASMIGPRLAATKRAAVELVKQLSPEDLVGVFAFDTQPYVVVEVQPAGQVGQSLIEKLVTLRANSGTDIFPALATAANRLDLTDATMKHILLLSDGNTPVNQRAYNALLQSFKLSGVTISTIGIGSAFINEEYLQWLAQATGGTFYRLDNLGDVPRLIARDTEQSLGRLPFAEGYFRPLRTPETDWFADTPQLPPLKGYLTATARPGAQVDLTVRGGDEDDPLLARWPVGQGRVVVFTSDADARWSPEWIRWHGFEGAWAQIIRWAMRRRMSEELFVRVDERGGHPVLMVEGDLQNPSGELASPSGERIPLGLIQAGRWRWEAPLEQLPGGWYQLVLESRAAAEHGAASPQSAAFATRWVHLGVPQPSAETTGQPANEALLRQMARATGGAYELPDAALVPETVPATRTEPVASWWLPLVILVLLIDVALRGSSML